MGLVILNSNILPMLFGALSVVSVFWAGFATWKIFTFSKQSEKEAQPYYTLAHISTVCGVIFLILTFLTKG